MRLLRKLQSMCESLLFEFPEANDHPQVHMLRNNLNVLGLACNHELEALAIPIWVVNLVSPKT